MPDTTTFDGLRDTIRSERGALVAAAVLPALPDGESFVRVKESTRYECPDETEAFVDHAPTFAGTDLVRAVVDGDTPPADTVDITPRPHARNVAGPGNYAPRSYRLSAHDVDLITSVGKGGFDFEDTDQAFLSDFGATPSPVDTVHLGERTDDTFDRKPRFPAD